MGYTESIWSNTFSSGEVINVAFNSGDIVESVLDFDAQAIPPISPYYLPEAQCRNISNGRGGTLATQVIGGTIPQLYSVYINGVRPLDLINDGYGVWQYNLPSWFGSNPVRVSLIPIDAYGVFDTYGTIYEYEQEIFLERLFVPQQDGVESTSLSDSVEGTYYENEGYGALPDAYGSTKVLFSCAQAQFPSKLRVKFLTNRKLSSGVITNGVEREGYLGYKKYFGESPLFDGHKESVVEFDDGYEHFYTIREDGYQDGYGVFRDPLRKYGVDEITVISGEQIQILPDSKYNVYDEAENQVLILTHSKNERKFLLEGETLVQLEEEPDNINEIQIYREYDFITRIPAALPIAFDSRRKVLQITPFDTDGYGSLWARIAYTVAGVKTFVVDGYGETKDSLEKNSLEFDFRTSLKKKNTGLERNYETEILDNVTDQKMHLYFFKKNEYNVEMQLNPGFNIKHSERFAQLGNELNPYYYDNGKREIIVRTDYRGLDIETKDGDGYGPIV